MKQLKIFLFYLLSFTWGILLSMVGLLTSIVLLIAGFKPEIFHGRIHFKVGEQWGGVNLGPVFITDNSPSLHTKQHECGHGIQNIILGPLMPFSVCIPSAVRYWVIHAVLAKKLIYIKFALFAINVVLLLATMIFLIYSYPLLFLFTGASFLYFIYITFWSLYFEADKWIKNKNTKYDSVWFEGSATKIGEKLFR
jgi:hypothetical protein